MNVLVLSPPDCVEIKPLFFFHQCLMELLKQEVETSFKAPCFHFIETIPSFLREMPRIMLREHIMVSIYVCVGVDLLPCCCIRSSMSLILCHHVCTQESGPYMSFEEARKICLIELTKTKDIACVQLVYGHAGL